MADLTFNTTGGQTIARELMILYLNTGTSGSHFVTTHSCQKKQGYI